MTNIELPYFGQIDLTQLEEYYSVETEWNGSILSLDLNFNGKYINEEQTENIKTFLDNISKFELQNKSVIYKNFLEEGEASDYINFYLEEFDEEELSNITESKHEQRSTTKHQLLSKLKLIRVGLYPDGKYGTDYFGVFDYSIEIDGEPCNQLLVVKTNETGDLDHITWES